MGMIGDRYGLRAGFFILPVLFLLLLILLPIERKSSETAPA